jgi:ribosomal protein S27AE
MEALDGNALAGSLYELFDDEMTTETGVCRSCGQASVLAEVRVYARAPGSVARCPGCGNVLFVIAEIAGAVRINLDGIELRGHSGGAPAPRR